MADDDRIDLGEVLCRAESAVARAIVRGAAAEAVNADDLRALLYIEKLRRVYRRPQSSFRGMSFGDEMLAYSLVTEFRADLAEKARLAQGGEHAPGADLDAI